MTTAPRTDAPLPIDELLAHQGRVRTLAARLAFDPAHAEDLEQEVWCAALRRPPGRHVAARDWLGGVVRNLARMTARAGRRRRRHETSAATERAMQAPGTDVVAARAELQRRLIERVQALPAPLREVVLLRWFEDLPPRHIAKRLGAPVATVHTRLQRALERLRADLDADYGDRRAWALPFAAMARPADVAATTGGATLLLHAGILLMKTKTMLLVATAVVAATVTMWIAVAGGGERLADYSHTGEVADALTVRAPGDADGARTADGAAAGAGAARQGVAADDRVRGRVVDRHGRPVVGAFVHHDTPQWFRTRCENGEWSAATMATESAADGTFALPRLGDGSGRLSARHDDWVTDAEHVDYEPGEEPVVVMFRTHAVPLVVEVVDTNTGTPPPLFVCSATTFWKAGGMDDGAQRWLSAPRQQRCTTGRFEGTATFVEGLPLQVRAYAPGAGLGEWEHDRDTNGVREVQPVAGQPIHLRFELDLGAAERVATDGLVAGRVVDDATGEPVPGAEVGIGKLPEQPDDASYRVIGLHWVRRVQTGFDGTFRIARPRGAATEALEITHPDYQTEQIEAPRDDAGTIRLRPRGSLRCRIVDGGGRPLAGVPFLFCTRSTRVHERGRTDERGELFFDGLQADTYHVFLLRRWSDADEMALASDAWSVRPGDALEVTLSTDPPDRVHVVGTVTGTGAPVVPVFVPHAQGAFVRARRRGPAGFDAGGMERGEYLVAIAPANDGDRSVRIALLPRVAITAFGTQAIDLHVPAGVVRGRVAIAAGEAATTPRAQLRVVAVPVVPPAGAAAELLASGKFTEVQGVPLDDAGAFELTSLHASPHVLQLRHGARVLAERRVDVAGVVDIGTWHVDP